LAKFSCDARFLSMRTLRETFNEMRTFKVDVYLGATFQDMAPDPGATIFGDLNLERHGPGIPGLIGQEDHRGSRLFRRKLKTSQHPLVPDELRARIASGGGCGGGK